jgi:hypothetical protein
MSRPPDEEDQMTDKTPIQRIKGAQRDIIGKLNAAAVEALADPAVRSRLVDLGLEIFPRERQTPEALGALQRAAAEKWWPIIKELGINGQ